MKYRWVAGPDGAPCDPGPTRPPAVQDHNQHPSPAAGGPALALVKRADHPDPHHRNPPPPRLPPARPDVGAPGAALAPRVSPTSAPADHPGLALAVGLEGVQYLLPYRAWNMNDAIGNRVGVLFSPLLLAIRRLPRCGGQRAEVGVRVGCPLPRCLDGLCINAIIDHDDY